MVSLLNYGDVVNFNVLILYGLSSDIKPINKIENIFITNGSIFNEIDTGKVYKYKSESNFWNLIKGGDINDYIK